MVSLQRSLVPRSGFYRFVNAIRRCFGNQLQKNRIIEATAVLGIAINNPDRAWLASQRVVETSQNGVKNNMIERIVKIENKRLRRWIKGRYVLMERTDIEAAASRIAIGC